MKHANVNQADIPLPRTEVGLLLPLSSTNEDEDSYTPCELPVEIRSRRQ
jgi:hypothetical protein